MKSTLIAIAIVLVTAVIATVVYYPKEVTVDETVIEGVKEAVSFKEIPTEEITTAETTTAETTIETTEAVIEVSYVQSLGKFYVTGYTAEEGFSEGSITASGVGCRPGICAMNKTQMNELGIKYGDSIYIEELGTYTVQDCGCGYGVVDIWLYSNAEAYAITGNYEVFK